eukprot:1753012-Pyramimonas_sp.AAC.1
MVSQRWTGRARGLVAGKDVARASGRRGIHRGPRASDGAAPGWERATSRVICFAFLAGARAAR